MCPGYQPTPVIKSSGFLVFRRVYIVHDSSCSCSLFRLFIPFFSLVLTPSLGLSLSLFLSLLPLPPLPDSRLNGSRSLALALAGRGLHVVSRYVKFWLACAGSGPGEQPVIY